MNLERGRRECRRGVCNVCACVCWVVSGNVGDLEECGRVLGGGGGEDCGGMWGSIVERKSQAESGEGGVVRLV